MPNIKVTAKQILAAIDPKLLHIMNIVDASNDPAIADLDITYQYKGQDCSLEMKIDKGGAGEPQIKHKYEPKLPPEELKELEEALYMHPEVAEAIREN